MLSGQFDRQFSRVGQELHFVGYICICELKPSALKEFAFFFFIDIRCLGKIFKEFLTPVT